MEKYCEFYSYLSYFEELSGIDTSAILEDISLFYVSYEDKINEFVSCFYESDFTDTDYGVP